MSNMITERSPAAVLILILCMLVVLGLYLGAADLDVTGAGESRTAEIAREMYQRGDYLLPSLRGEVSVESLTKPPLFHWVLIASASPFDWANFSLRIPSILSAIACLLLVFRLASRLFDDQAGAFAVLVLACSGLFLDYGISARIDMFFTALVVAAMVGLEAAVRRENRTVPLALFFIATGLAVLAKGPLGLAIPVGTAIVYVLTARPTITLSALFPWWGILLMLGIALPWYVYVFLAAPPELVEWMFLGEFRNWLEGEAATGDQTTPWFYLLHLLGGMFPFSLFLPVALWQAVAHIRHDKQRTLLLILVWFLGGLLLFSIGGKKSGRYLLPIIPAAAILLGWYWRQLMSDFSRYRTGAVISAAFAMLAVLLITGALLFGLADPDKALETANRELGKTDKIAFVLLWEVIEGHLTAVRVYIASVAGLALLSFIAVRRSQVRLAAASYSLIVLLLTSAYFHVILPHRAQSSSLRAIAVEVHQLVGDDSRLAGGGSAYKRAFHWYLERHFDRHYQGKLEEMVLEEPATPVFITHRKPLPPKVLAARQYRQWNTPAVSVTFFMPVDPGLEHSSTSPREQ